MDKPYPKPSGIDANLMIDLAGCSHLGLPALAVFGCPLGLSMMDTSAVGNSFYQSLDSDDKVKFLLSAMAELQVMFIELTDSVTNAPDVQTQEQSKPS